MKGRQLMRNVEKNIMEGQKIVKNNDRLDLYGTDMQTFFNQFKDISEKKNSYDALWEVIGNAYYMGLAVGTRNGVRGNC